MIVRLLQKSFLETTSSHGVIMHINVVTVSSGWILQKIAERIVEAGNRQDLHTRQPHNGTIKEGIRWRLSHVPRVDCAANYYVDIQNCYRGPTSVLDIGYFTHLHENDQKHIQPHWLKLDFIVHKCTRYYDVFKQFYPESKMDLIYPGEIPEGFYLKKPTIGIFQRGKYEGKGFHFMSEMLDKHMWILDSFKWHFVGNDWGPVVEKMEAFGMEVTDLGDTNLSYPEGYAQEYDKIDYLLIPSLWEGGPMSVIEANAKGIPIIAANVGWCGADLPVDYLFPPNATDELASILHTILAPSVSRRAGVGFLSYEFYARKLATIVGRLRGEEVR